ncbi:hypothetical protein ILUMI_15864 [Ignelater luminosus]|uniref:Uncharacterized protein n=1 Tax=Ignelater luminosus TaxID=2038154 RepID=A0A8K0G8Q2_IGNLU|nr:hypothetical protein ILUMI_15864 [Ignelater luminosus]
MEARNDNTEIWEATLLVKLDDDGYILKRHVNQLLRVTIDLQPKKRVTFAPFLPSNIHPHDNDEQGRGPPVEFQQEPSEVHPEPAPILRRSVRERRPPRKLQDYDVSFIY